MILKAFILIHASIRTSVYDFAIEFGEVDKIEINKNQADMYVELKAGIVMSPQHAKAFFNILKKNLEEYEKQFGEIKLPDIVGSRESNENQD